MSWREFVRMLMSSSERLSGLSGNAVLRRAAQLTVYQWIRIAERAGVLGRGVTGWLEIKGHTRLVRFGRNFAQNLREEMKKISGGRGY